MDFRILGPLEVLDEGRAVALGGSKQRALLALFLVHANETLTTDRLIDELWGERPPANAAKTVQMHISRLRKALAADPRGDLLVTRERGYELRLDPDQLDSHRFERLTAEGRGELGAGRPERAAETLEHALSLWRDAPLADLAYEPFAASEIARLEDLRVAVLEQLVEAKLELGRHAEVIAELETLIGEHPFRERLRAQLMLALYRSERQADALQAYQDARTQLVEELGIEPGERLRELERAILAQDPELAAPAPPRRDSPGAETRAPAQDELPTGVVTFLLTDIEGSSGLWEADPEAMAEALQLHDELIARTVEEHGGRLLKTKGEGDATVAVFRRASDAVAGAVELQRALHVASWPGELALRVRIALHTGEAHERDGDYFGAALNRAARLRALIGGGATVLSRATAEIVHDRLPREVELVDLGRRQLRGLSRPENVFELRRPPAPTAPQHKRKPVTMPSSVPSALGLLERDDELQTIVQAFAGAAEGNGRVVLVEGPAGIGKTSLLGAVDGDAVQVLRARGAELERDFGWGVVRQLFERWLADRAGDERNRLFRGAAGPARAALGEPDAYDQHPFAAVHGLYWLTLNAAELHPLVLVVDDAQWCDEASLRWLAYLSARLDDTPASLVLGVRRPEPGADREPLLQMAGQTRTCIVRPAPLSVSATSQLLMHRLQLDSAEQLSEACHESTGGNPFLLRALLDDLAQMPRDRPPDPEAIRDLRPAAISRAVLLRMRALPESTPAVTRAIAVLGGSATGARAAGVAGLDPDVTAVRLRALAAAGIVEDALPPVFVHPLVHAVVLDDMRAPERSAWHVRAAEVLRDSGASTDEIAAQLVLCEPAGDPAVVSTLVESAKAALARGAPEAAVDLLARALEEPPPHDQLATLERLRGRALLRARGAEGLDAFRAALAAAVTPAELADTALELARALEGLSRNVEAVAVYEQALADLDGSGVPQTRELEAGLTVAAAQHLSTLPLAFEILGAAAQRPSAPDAADSIMRATLALATTASGSPDGIAMAEAALADGQLFDATPSIAIALAIAPLVWGDRLDAALDAWNEVIRRATARSEPITLALGLIYRGDVHLRAGRLADAEADLRAALDLPQEMWIASAVPVDAPALLAEVLFDRSGPEAAAEVLKELGPAEAVSDYQGNNLVLMARGRARLGLGHAEEALADMIELGQRCESWMLRNPAAFPWRCQAALALRSSDRARAQELAAEEVQLARAFGAARAIGISLRADGIVRGGTDGLARLHEAVEVLAASPARLEHARALVDLGAARRRAGHRDAARAHLAEGLDGAVVCGAQALVQRARAELALAGARPRRDRVTGRDALTASELRVARLAAAGRTNREIAELNWVTRKTVETHLGNAYRKLGIRTRSELPNALSDAAPDVGTNFSG